MRSRDRHTLCQLNSTSHIVPKRGNFHPNDSRYDDSRDANDVLDHYGISPEEAAAGMYLPNKHAKGKFDWEASGPQHPPLDGDPNIHNQAYYRALAQRLMAARDSGKNAGEVRDELQKIAMEISKGTFPGIPNLP